MKASLLYTTVIFVSAATAQTLDPIQKLESSGDTLSARAALSRAAQNNPKDIAAWTAYAEFLDRYGDPTARDAYGKLLAALNSSGDKARASAVARRIALLDLVEGDRGAAARNLET